MQTISAYGRQSHQGVRLVLVYGLTILAVFLIELVGWAEPVERTLGRMLTPLSEQAAYSVRVVLSPLGAMAHSYRSEVELSELRVQHGAALAKLTELERVEAENVALRQLIQNRHIDLTERIVASAITSYVQPTISAGSEDGVRPGQLVGSNGVLLGRVRQVSERQSSVELLTSPNAEEQLLVVLESGSQGVIKGNGRFAVVTHVSRTAEIQLGERVITLGQPGVPAGVLVGVVGQLVHASTEPFTTVRLEQPQSFYSVSIVEVW